MVTATNVESRADAVEAGEKSRALRRIKLVATLALVACILVFLAARWLAPRYPAMAYVAAFAEAAAIGGLADWYAVVALFRRPLGLPIPHTAIVPANKDRIATNLGRFIEVNFLATAAVRTRLAEVDFALMIAEWLSDGGRAGNLSRFLTSLTPQILNAVAGSGLREFLSRRVAAQVERIDIAPAAAGLLASFTADRRHQRLFDEFLKAFGTFLADEQALAAIRDKIRDELPTVANLFRADAYLLKRIVASSSALIEEVRADPDHPLRAEFDRFVEGFIERLRSSPDYAARAERLKRDLLARPELRLLADEFFASMRDFVERDAERPDSMLGRRLTNMLVEIGRQLVAEPQLKRNINEGVVAALAAFVENQKSGVSAFIADQVRSWDVVQLTRLIELNIGRDLQYIRFNGMIVGGLAGLGLHIGERLIFGG